MSFSRSIAVRGQDLRNRTIHLFGVIAALGLAGFINNVLLGGRLSAYGIVPRTQDGLWGIVLAPFLHASFNHLYANACGILIFGGLVMLRSKQHFWVVTLLGTLVSGVGTWVFGRSAVHIGASGVVFAYFGYLLFCGVFERRIWPLLLSCVVLAVWGPTLYGVLPTQPGVSWEAHAFGLLGGIWAAQMVARRA